MAAEHLVPPAGDRFLGGRHQSEQDIAQRVAPVDLLGAGQEEATGTVVQQRGIGVPKGRRHRDVPLVPG